MEAAMTADSYDGAGLAIAVFPHGTRVMRVSLIQMLNIDPDQQTTELRPFAAPVTRSSALLIWLPLMWMAILAVLTATFVALFK